MAFAVVSTVERRRYESTASARVREKLDTTCQHDNKKFECALRLLIGAAAALNEGSRRLARFCAADRRARERERRKSRRAPLPPPLLLARQARRLSPLD